MRSRAKSPQPHQKARIRALLAEAQSLGYLEDGSMIELSARVPGNLLAAAKRQIGVGSNAKLLVIALSLLAVQDDFGERLLRRKGSVDPSATLEI